MEKTYKVLIVDDDPMVAMINEQYVCKNKQFKVVGSCRNGQDALNFLEKNPVDLVIMDVYMPDMDGLETLKKIREKISDVSLTTDIMLGFPGETEEDVEEALSLLREVKYESAFMYYYNPREGTPAASMPNQIDMAEKKRRLQKIIDTQLLINQEAMKKRVGTTAKVLVEAVSRDSDAELLGKIEQDERVVFAGDKSLIGQFVTVHLDSLNGSTFRGTLAK